MKQKTINEVMSHLAKIRHKKDKRTKEEKSEYYRQMSLKRRNIKVKPTENA